MLGLGLLRSVFCVLQLGSDDRAPFELSPIMSPRCVVAHQFHDRVDGELDGMRKDLHNVAKKVDLSRARAKKKVATKKRAMLKR